MFIELVEEACGDKSVTGTDTQLSQTLWKGGYAEGVQRKRSVRQAEGDRYKRDGIYRHGVGALEYSGK